LGLIPKKTNASSLALMEAASPDLEKQGFFSRSFC
jgi:hypothetical protein